MLIYCELIVPSAAVLRRKYYIFNQDRLLAGAQYLLNQIQGKPLMILCLLRNTLSKNVHLLKNLFLLIEANSLLLLLLAKHGFYINCAHLSLIWSWIVTGKDLTVFIKASECERNNTA